MKKTDAERACDSACVAALNPGGLTEQIRMSLVWWDGVGSKLADGEVCELTAGEIRALIKRAAQAAIDEVHARRDAEAGAP